MNNRGVAAAPVSNDVRPSRVLNLYHHILCLIDSANVPNGPVCLLVVLIVEIKVLRLGHGFRNLAQGSVSFNG